MDVIGDFGLDLCVFDGWAEIVSVTNNVSPDQLVPTEVLMPTDQDCHGMLRAIDLSLGNW